MNLPEKYLNSMKDMLKDDFDDYLESIKQMKKLGGLGNIMNMLPGLGGMGMGKMKGLGDEQMDEAEKGMARMEAMIHSMTPAERRDPDLLKSIKKAQNRKRSRCRHQ